jgi:uncharacterized membrane protein (UPF0127 family)
VRIETPEGRSIDIEASRIEGIAARMRGLIGRPELSESSGVLLRGKQVHTFGMRYPIDVLHIAPDGTILNVTSLRPWKVSPIRMKARWVLELRSGEADRLGIGPGSVVVNYGDS